MQHEGFQEAAVEFTRECSSNAASASNVDGDYGFPSEIPQATLQLMHKRQQIKIAICSGNIDAAIVLVNEVNPRILNVNGELFFKLMQQKLLELIRQAKVDQALQFAQQEIVPQAEANPQFLPALEQTMALLAFDLQKANEHVLQALHPCHRANVAAAVNEAILEASGEEKESKLGAMLKQLSWAQERLAEKVAFPRIVVFSNPEANLTDASGIESSVSQ